jgi:hypothetical protein
MFACVFACVCACVRICAPIGADYATCQDATYSPGGVCQEPGKGAGMTKARAFVIDQRMGALLKNAGV